MQDKVPRTAEEYKRYIDEKLNWLERTTDKVTSLDQRVDTSNLLLMEILKNTSVGVEIQLPTGFPSYNIRKYELDTVRTSPGQEVSIPGDIITAFTDGTLVGTYVRFDEPTNDAIPLSEFNPYYYPATFKKFFLETTAQPGKYLRLHIGRGGAEAEVDVSSLTFNIDIAAQAIGNLNINLAAAAIMMPIDIQASYIMMPVDIQAQYITLEMDIVAQTIGNLGIDIKAQTIGNLAVNIAASAITLNVSVQNAYLYIRTEAAQNLRIDIVAQTVGNLAVNIAASAITLNVAIASSAVTLNVNISSITGGVTFNIGTITGTVNVAIASAVTLNINIASSAVTLNVTVTNASIAVTGTVSITGTPSVTISGTPTVSISGTVTVSVTGTANIQITAQTVGVYTQPDWASKEGEEEQLVGSVDITAGSWDIAISYTVPAGKQFYITHWSVACEGYTSGMVGFNMAGRL